MFLKQETAAEKWAEALAVLLNLSYLALYISGSNWCWPAAFIGSGIFVVLCYNRKMLAEVVLQVFYVGFAVYGYLNEWQAEQWAPMHHAWLIGVSVLLTVIMGFVLRNNSKAALPYLDSFTTVFSLSATWLMVNLVHENYLYWMVIDAASAYLYWQRGLKFGSAMFIVYLVMVCLGYFRWI